MMWMATPNVRRASRLVSLSSGVESTWNISSLLLRCDHQETIPNEQSLVAGSGICSGPSWFCWLECHSESAQTIHLLLTLDDILFF